MSDFKLFVRYKGDKKSSEALRQKLSDLKFSSKFVSTLIGSKKATDVTEYMSDMTYLGVMFGDEKELLDDLVVRVKSEKSSNYITAPFKFENILKQVVISDPNSFKSIAKRSGIKGNLKLLEKYEKANKKPFYSFTKKEAEQAVGDLSKGNRTPITIKSIVKNASVIEEKISAYVREYANENTKPRRFTNVWADVSLVDITGETDRKFLTKSEITKLVNRRVFGERNSQYTSLALLTYKGVRIDKYSETNEMALIKMDDINVAEKSVLVGVGDYRRKINFDDDEWSIIRRTIDSHEPEKGIYLFQPFKTTRTIDQPLTRWSLVQRLHDLSSEIYNNPNTADYKVIRLSGINYMFSMKLMNHGIMISKNMRNPEVTQLATECLQQFGDLPITNLEQIRKTTTKTKIDRLKLNTIQYTESF